MDGPTQSLSQDISKRTSACLAPVQILLTETAGLLDLERGAFVPEIEASRAGADSVAGGVSPCSLSLPDLTPTSASMKGPARSCSPAALAHLDRHLLCEAMPLVQLPVSSCTQGGAKTAATSRQRRWC
eukprot:CAMPEP_0115748760 /NCGR_PEP_ID=MMETSP0272-20121206/93839_1 /TAXON_ID=71861 /ORGANISM="Scrippsiella trochoidea, Strain CCMP3099" /LENGTH=127 /DNA_ID=CAMNT_0003193783 /DNA_START=125 /DNA_END=510 /DNA_ORIENTATION=+